MKAKIEIVVRELIKPSSPTPHHLREHKLSFIDQFFPHLYIPFLFFYQNSNPDNVDPSKTSQTLKQSLSETLTKFYPLAGKLSTNSQDFHVVDCDDSGVLFVEAKVSAPALQQSLEDDEKVVQYLPFDPFAVDELVLGLHPRNETLLGVQITYFESGVIAFGVCISHKVADFASLMCFLDSWAAANLGDDGNSVVKELNFDSGRNIFPPVRLQEDVRPRIFDRKDDRETEKLTLKRFVLNKEKMIQLKDLASSSQIVKDPTRVEVVTAFLWKEFMKMSPAEAKLKFRVGHLVNLRSRMSSFSDHANFAFGNLSVFAATDSLSEEDGEDFGELVRLIRGSIRKKDDEFVVLNGVDTIPGVKTSGLSKGEGVIHWQFSSYCRYQIHDLNFGWGKPVSVGPSCTLNFPSVTLLDTSDEDGLEVWINMSADAFALLPTDLLSLQATHLFQINT